MLIRSVGSCKTVHPLARLASRCALDESDHITRYSSQRLNQELSQYLNTLRDQLLLLSSTGWLRYTWRGISLADDRVTPPQTNSILPKREPRPNTPRTAPLLSQMIKTIRLMKHYLKATLLLLACGYLTLHFTHKDEGWRARIQDATAKRSTQDGADQGYDLTDMVTMNRLSSRN